MVYEERCRLPQQLVFLQYTFCAKVLTGFSNKYVISSYVHHARTMLQRQQERSTAYRVALIQFVCSN